MRFDLGKLRNIKSQCDFFISPLIDKYDRFPICRLILSVMPYGNILDVALSQAAADIKQRRLEYFFEKLNGIMDTILDIQEYIVKLDAEEFYNFLRDVANLAVDSRMDEIRDIIAAMVKEAVIGESKVYNLESLIARLSDFRGKDIAILKYVNEFIKKYPSCQSNVIHSQLNAKHLTEFINKDDFDEEECTWLLNRLANLCILNRSTVEMQPLNIISYSTTKVFNKIIGYWNL